MRVVLIGPPGCGKGTQAERLKTREGLTHLSTGDLLRAAVAAGTSLGLRAKPLMDAGKLVPDEIVIGLVRERIVGPGAAKKFLLDGFPRTIAQADALEGTLDAAGLSIDVVVHYVLGDDEIVRRGLGRGRADDTEPVLRERLRVYRAQTEPLVARYRRSGLLVDVDASGSIDEVDGLTRAAIAGRGGKRPKGGGMKGTT